MTAAPETALQSFVLLRLGERRFALPASQVAELVAPSRIFRFPHKSPALEGVILRRGRMIAICDIAEQLTGSRLTTRRFTLIATRKYERQLDWIAIPVSGECELINVTWCRPAPTILRTWMAGSRTVAKLSKSCVCRHSLPARWKR